jgi:hypothetical protein
MLRGLLAIAATTGLSLAASAQSAMESTDYDQFAEQFCAADHAGQHVFVLPASVLVDRASVECDNGVSAFRVAEPADDPGHYVFNIDPPPGAETGFDCDGKADVGMTVVAINCLPASMETAEHPKD